ncbi:hypothetical protein [Hyphomonas sp.]|uniref:hypothetical protein n=1 Tax=Hyphomonas sp. TaxID=87 RepID=UPI00356945E9
MSGLTATGGTAALAALLDNRDRFGKLLDKDFAAATGLLVRKLMNAGGQTCDDMAALRDAVGTDIFETELKRLSAHQARLLAKRIDKAVDDFEVSTAGAAAAHIRKVMSGDLTMTKPAATPQADTPATDAPDDRPPTDEGTPRNSYFGRKSFRSGN